MDNQNNLSGWRFVHKIETELAKALGIDLTQRKIKRLTLDLDISKSPIVTIEEYVDHFDGTQLSSYQLVPVEKIK